MRDILLVEPDYKNKYPPLGLMKISEYHKRLGDRVFFVKGKNSLLRNKKWDRIYVTTLFTFYWNKTIETINYYRHSQTNDSEIFIGGILASLLGDELLAELDSSSINVIAGLLDESGILDENEWIVDKVSPDYSIINNEENDYLDYEYPVANDYIVYSTRGCVRTCRFCAVPVLEPKYCSYIDIKDQVSDIKKKYGEKRNLLLMDNNVLASKDFERIVSDIIELGYGKNDNKYSYRSKKTGRKVTVRRYVDFNQGVDARLLTDEKLSLISQLAIRPLRVALDHANEEYMKLYSRIMRKSASLGIKHLSNYLLYNFEDTPKDLYSRIMLNVKLNTEFKNEGYDTQIFSFPMRYAPIFGSNNKNRKYIGDNWNKKYIRAIQCILSATHGVVGPKEEFNLNAFGSNLEEFYTILMMPEDFIIYREFHRTNGNAASWKKSFDKLSKDKDFVDIIRDNKFKEHHIEFFPSNFSECLSYYYKSYTKKELEKQEQVTETSFDVV